MKLLRKIHSLLPLMMLRDSDRILRRLKSMHKRSRGTEIRLDDLLKQAESSVRERERRAAGKPPVTFPEELPIASRAEEITRLIRENPVVIVSGETGCGKSTQIPKMCLAAGRGVAGTIGCTQPRRIAAVTIAHRIAQELGEDVGRSVGYKIRFRDRTGPCSLIKIMTDGMLLAETQADAMLREYDTLIIDEAHERTLNIDFILGILKTILPARPELKVIIASATLDTEKFSEAFGGAPVAQISGRLYPIDVEYLPLDPVLEEQGETTYVDMALRAVDSLRLKKKSGDLLIFMPTEEDILETCERLGGRRYPGTEILPLFARLPASEQGRVYSTKGDKIVVATNVAETSLTIPGIRYVIDTGLARIPRYLPKTRTTSLAIGPISRSSADQRKGRCGRVQHGVCIRLYSEEDYKSRPLFTPPEIQRSNLAEVILRMLFLRLGNPRAFPFLDPPGDRSIKDGFDVLSELGALKRKGQDAELTPNGKLMARLPLDPRISRMLIEARKESCLEETTVIAAALSIQDPRDRPLEKALQADRMHVPFKDPDSDFMTLLKIWNRYHREWESLKTQNRMRKFCKEQFLSYARMREWVHTHDQIKGILREQRMAHRQQGDGILYDRVHRSVLSGFLSNIALRKEKNLYLAARGREVMVFPGSTLFRKPPAWIVAAEIVKTSRLFARTVAGIRPEWIEALGGDLCRSTYSDPHWDRDRGEVRAFEQVSLFGLPIVSKRIVSYGSIDPDGSHKIFVDSALVEGNLDDPPPFLSHNRSLVANISAMEAKLRRRDILIGESALGEFYSARLKGVSDAATLRKTIRERGGDGFLRLKELDLMLYRPEGTELAQYPDRLEAGERSYPCVYAFAPGREEDGLTVKVPAGLISRIPAERLDWTVPGLLKEKVTALIKGLPKRYRKQLVPVSRTVDEILQDMPQGEQSLLNTLSAFVYHRYGVDVPASVWADVELPDHLKVRVALVDHAGKELEAGREIRLLGKSEIPQGLPESGASWKAKKEQWEKMGLTGWDFDELPERISLGELLFAYPALELVENCLNLRLFQDQEQALASHRKGVRWLLERRLAKDLKYQRRNLTLPTGAAAIGARHFGGSVVLEQNMMERLLVHFLEVDLRSSAALEKYSEKVVATIMDKGTALKAQVLGILEAFGGLKRLLESMDKSGNTERELALRIRQEMDALVPQNFLELHDSERLAHLPRYLNALRIRAQRGVNNAEKHRIKNARIEEFSAWLQQCEGNLSRHGSNEKRKALEAFRWMIEEFKVSVFAQELKTAFPVSAKRLEEKKKEIERMV
jgi:ATP-dependent helicase HrpA